MRRLLLGLTRVGRVRAGAALAGAAFLFRGRGLGQHYVAGRASREDGSRLGKNQARQNRADEEPFLGLGHEIAFLLVKSMVCEAMPRHR